MALPAGVTVRGFAPHDADRLGDIWIAGFADGVPGVAPAHTPDEIRRYMGHELPTLADVWVAAEQPDDRAIAFLALHEGWVEQLYVDPPCIGRGVGDALLDVAKRQYPRGLQLWTFQVNARARRFYTHRGFAEVELTDGATNDERAPDVRLVWSGDA